MKEEKKRRKEGMEGRKKERQREGEEDSLKREEFNNQEIKWHPTNFS